MTTNRDEFPRTQEASLYLYARGLIAMCWPTRALYDVEELYDDGAYCPGGDA
mgnify:CR=1 FL=1